MGHLKEHMTIKILTLLNVKNIEKEAEEYIKTKDEKTGYFISMSLNKGIGSYISIYSLNKNLISVEKKNYKLELINVLRR